MEQRSVEQRSVDIGPFSVRTLNDQELIVYVFSGQAYAQTLGLAGAFSFASDSGMRGCLSKLSIATVENNELKSALGLTGKIRWIDTAGIKKLLSSRLDSDKLLLQAEADLNSALNGEGRPVTTVIDDSVPASGAVVSDAASVGSDMEAADIDESPRPVIVHPKPRPVLFAAFAAQHLRIPREPEWYMDDQFIVGKKYSLEPFDMGEVLKKELHDYRTYWTDSDFLPNRKGEALRPATMEKREQRVLLYLGFLGNVIKAVDDPKSLTLCAVLNHHAVTAYIDWCQKARLMANSNIVENMSAFCSVVKFIHRNAPVAASNFADLEVLSRYKSMRNRLSSKALNPHKTSTDLEAEGKWLPFELFIEAIESLQREFDAAVADANPNAARLLHDLCLLRLYQACPSRSGEVRQLEYMDWEALDDLRGRKVLSRYVLDSHRNVLTRRPLSCFSMHIGASKNTKKMGISSTDFQEVC